MMVDIQHVPQYFLLRELQGLLQKSISIMLVLVTLLFQQLVLLEVVDQVQLQLPS
jgi:hypothetical protein